MKKIYFLLFMLLSLHSSRGQSLTIPATYATTLPGGSIFGPLANVAYTYQLLIQESELTALVGQQLTGLSFRSPTGFNTSTSWPSATTTYNEYKIYLSEGLAPANRKSIFAENIVGAQSLVRSGPLVIQPDSYPAGGAASFGSSITFNQPYHYSGGHLLLEIRHSANDGIGRTIDAVPSYNSLYNSAITAGYAISDTATSTMSTFIAATIVRFDYGVPLPLQLLRFYGEAGESANDLYWETAEESNCAYFEIEKGIDGKSFLPLGRVISANGSAKNKYTYTDRNIDGRKNFYRLKMTDQDQGFSYSKVIELDHTDPEKSNLLVTPNPFNDKLFISLVARQQGPVSLRFIDALGRLCYSGEQQVLKGNYSFEIITDQLPSGFYILEIKGAVNQVLRIQKL